MGDWSELGAQRPPLAVVDVLSVVAVVVVGMREW